MANESRLIDASAILLYALNMEYLALQRSCDTPINSLRYKRYFAQYTERKEFRELIQNAPTVDAVEVVRCKDCDNRVYIDMGAEIGVVGGCCIYKAALPEDFYCAYGKRGD